MRKQLDGKIYLQKLQTFAYVSLGFPLLLFIYIYLESSVDQLVELIPAKYHISMLMALAFLSVALLYWNQRMFSSNLAQTKGTSELRAKLRFYQLASNRRFAIYGVCSLLICIGFYLTNFQPFAALFGIMLVLFSIHNPNTRRIVKDLQLKDRNKEIILKGLDVP